MSGLFTQEEKEWVEQALPLLAKAEERGLLTPLSGKLAGLLEKSLRDERTALEAKVLRIKHRAGMESNEIQDILAEALGYPYDEEFGYAIGDHDAVTLAMEARRKLGGEQ